MATSIHIEKLVKRFGTTTAVDQVSLTIEPGSLFFLLGPSGCGKTTLLRMLAGFTDPTGGVIRFGAREVTHLPPNRRNAGMVFQSYALWPHMTVAENVAFGLRVRKVGAQERQQRVQQALENVQMGPYAQRKPNELSGGQQQRVALARALVIQPDVLLLDEPLSNLDAKLRLDMRTQIRAICKQAGITAVYVTHDQKEALSMADSMAVLRAGQVMQVGPPRLLYHRPASRFVADFLGETNFVPATVRGREQACLVLDSPAGVLRSSVFPEGLNPGQAVTCSLRPEAIGLATEGHNPQAENSFPAQRADSVYLGETAQHVVILHPQVHLKVFELNPRLQEPAGSSLRVHFAAQDVVVLSEASPLAG